MQPSFFVPGPHGPVSIEALMGRLAAPAKEPISVHPETLKAAIKYDLVDWMPGNIDPIPTMMGWPILTDDTLPVIVNVEALSKFFIESTGLAEPTPILNEAPSCGCPEGTCLGTAGQTIEEAQFEEISDASEAFEPYEIGFPDEEFRTSTDDMIADLAYGFSQLAETGKIVAQLVKGLEEAA